MQQEAISNKLGGIYTKGYGLVPAVVMNDPALTPEAKVIYAYLATYSSSKFGTYFMMPSEKRICADLKIGHARYLTHRKQLEDGGYISLGNNRDINNSFTQYRCLLKDEVPSRIGTNLDLRRGVTQEGIISRGYGIVPRAFLTDPSVDIKAKSYYAFACVCAAANTRADRFADLDLSRMKKVLMSAHCLKKSATELLESGYVNFTASDIEGYTTCILLLHPRNGFSNDGEQVFEQYNPNEMAEQRQFIDNLFEPTSSIVGDSNAQDKAQPEKKSGMPELESIVASAVQTALRGIVFCDNNEILKNDTTGNAKNGTHIYYPNINITLNITSDLILSNKMGQDEKTQMESHIYSSSETNNINYKDKATTLKKRTAEDKKNDTTDRSSIFSTEEENKAATLVRFPEKDYKAEVEEQIEAGCWEDDESDESWEILMVDSIVSIMSRLYAMEGVGEVYIAGKKMPAHVVEEQYRQLRHKHIDTLLHHLRQYGEVSSSVENKEAYLRTCLYNARINHNTMTAFDLKSIPYSLK